MQLRFCNSIEETACVMLILTSDTKIFKILVSLVNISKFSQNFCEVFVLFPAIELLFRHVENQH